MVKYVGIAHFFERKNNEITTQYFKGFTGGRCIEFDVRGLRASRVRSNVGRQRHLGHHGIFRIVGQLRHFRKLGQLRHGFVRIVGQFRFERLWREVNEVTETALVAVGKLFLLTILMALSVTACNNGALDHADGGTKTSPIGKASADGGSEAGASLGTRIDDSVVTTKVKAALMADGAIKGSDISVETRRGEVMLSGVVNSDAQIDKAVKVANGVDGVKAVDNKMAVKR
jgi:hyperosmotically inducible periplasmic protein